MAGLDTTVSQGVVLSPEAKNILGQELQLFEGHYAPGQQQALQGVLSRLASQSPTTAATQGLAQTNQLARTATRTAGQHYGLPAREQGNNQTTLFEDEEDLLQALQALFEHIGTQQSSLIDPRFAQFLAPRVSNPGSGGPSTIESILPLIGAAAGTASQFV